MAFDPDAYLAEGGGVKETPFDPDAYLGIQKPVGTSIGQEISQLPAALKQSFGQPLEAIGETAQVAGFPAVATALKGAIQEPEGYVSAGQRFMEPQEGEFQVAGFAPQYAPRAIAEQTGQIIGSIGSRIAGAITLGGLGALISPATGAAGVAAGQFAGPALFEAAQIVGPVALERAKNNGYTEPTDEDMAYAITTAAGSGLLNAFGAKYLPGGEKAVGSFSKRLAASFIGEGIPEGLQSLVQQVGETVETKKGIQVSPKQAVGEALIGGGAGAAATIASAPFTPEQIEEQKITERANKEAENLVIGNDNPQGKAVLANKQKLEQEIADTKQVLSAIESTDPVAQKLKLELKEKEAILAAAQGQVDSIVDSNNPVVEAKKQQIELGKQITEKPAEVMPEVTPQVTEVVTPPTEVAPEVTPTTEVALEIVTPTEVKATEITPTVKETLPVAPVEEVVTTEAPAGVTKENFTQQKETIKVLNELTTIDRAALSGRLLSQGLITRAEALYNLQQASNEGITSQQISASRLDAEKKWNDRTRDGILAGRTFTEPAASVSADIAIRAEDARRKKRIVSRLDALNPKTVIGMTARQALKHASELNIITPSDLKDKEAIWRTGTVVKPNYALMQDAAAIIAEQDIPILDREKIVSLSSRGRRGRAIRFWAGDIGLPSTKGTRVETLVHEVAHTLTVDKTHQVAPRNQSGGRDYIVLLRKQIADTKIEEPVRRLMGLYISTLEQLGIMDQYGKVGGLAGTGNPDSSVNAARKLQAEGKLRKDLDYNQLYALANIEEFIAQTFSAPQFRDLLKTLKDPNTKKSIWREFVQAIKDLFGFTSDSMAAAVIDATFDIAKPTTVEEALIANKELIVGNAIAAGIKPEDAEFVADEIITETIDATYAAIDLNKAIDLANGEIFQRVVSKYLPKQKEVTPATPTPAVSETITEPIEGKVETTTEGEPTPIEPEAKTTTEGLVQGIDIGKENNMPINNKIESHIKNLAFVRGIFESASDRLRRAKFTKLATAIDDYYDQAQRRLGFANKILLPAFDEYSKQSKSTKKRIDEEVKMFFAAQENKRDTDEFFDELNPITQKIVTAWQKFGEESGKENQRIGIKVFDRGLQRWRPIGRVEKFWPRVLKPEYKRALMEPDKYQKEYNEIVEALMKSGRINTPEEAEVFISDYQGTGSQNDYFSGIEAARGQAFPEELYDYSMQVMTDYVARWAQHSSRIEQFGQKLGENSKTLWDRSRESTRDRRTIDYITAAQERVEGYYPNDPIVKGMATLNIWSSGLQLGNPASSMLNFFGGITLNAMVGQPGAFSSYLSSFVELRKLGRELKDAREKGIVSRDLMNIVGDHQVVLESSGLAKAGQKTTDFLLKWSGFTPIEQMVRTQSMIIGKSFLRKTLSSLSKNPNSSFSKRALTWLNRNNIDADKLIVEQGTGPETDKLLRYFANISQGSYTIAQTPIFTDTPIGRFLFKYQKFSTQVMRQSWKNTFEPAWRAVTNKNETLQLPDPTRQLLYRLRLAEAKELGDNRKITLDEIPKKVTKAEGKALTIIPVMMWLGASYVGGEVILRLRDMLFGVLMKGPDYEDIIRAFEDDEDDDELYLSLERAWYNLIGMGALGLIGNYAQFFMDWQDRERVKNPLDPPALSIFKETATFIQNAVDQGKITVGDVNNYLNRTFSAYRVSQRLYQTAASGLGYSDAPTVAEEMFRREVASINKYARRWAESAGLEYRTKRPMDIAPSKMTPINREIANYLQRGEPGAAAAYAKEYLKSLPKKERANAIQSMESGARNRQPLRLGSGPMDQTEKIAFKKWLKEKVSKEKFDEIQKLDSQYQKNYNIFLNNLPNK